MACLSGTSKKTSTKTRIFTVSTCMPVRRSFPGTACLSTGSRSSAEIHPEISLHYWDWTTDPPVAERAGRVALFTPNFMGGTGNPAGPPFQDFESTEKTDPFEGDGIHDHIWRNVGLHPRRAMERPTWPRTPIFLLMTSSRPSTPLCRAHHNNAHGFIGGTLGDSHFSFHDPFVFLLHSNMDRLWARWQTDPAHPGRIVPSTAYGLAVPPAPAPIRSWSTSSPGPAGPGWYPGRRT